MSQDAQKSAEQQVVSIQVTMSMEDFKKIQEYADFTMPTVPGMSSVAGTERTALFFLTSALDAVNRDLRSVRALLPSSQKRKQAKTTENSGQSRSHGDSLPHLPASPGSVMPGLVVEPDENVHFPQS